MTFCIMVDTTYCRYKRYIAFRMGVTMAMTMAIEQQEVLESWKQYNKPNYNSYIGMDLMDTSVDEALAESNPSWLQKLTCTPAGVAVLVLLTIVLSPILVVFGAFYGSFKPFGR